MIKNIITALFFSLFCFSCQAQTYWARVKENGQWMYIDTLGQKQLACPYEHCQDFSEGKALVRKQLGWGFMDKSGKVEKGFLYLSNIAPYKEGFAAYEGYFLDKEERPVFANHGFTSSHSFSEGFAIVRKGNRWGFINKKGEVIFSPRFRNMGNFSEGIAAVRVKHKWIYIDTTGNPVLKFQRQIDYCKDFHDGVALVRYFDYSGWGMINHKGKVIVNGAALKLEPANEGYMCLFDQKKTPHIATILDSTGALFMQLTYTGLYMPDLYFGEGLIGIEKEGKVGYVNKSKEWIIPAQFEVGKPFKNGKARVKVDGKWGFINKKGEWILPARFEEAENFHAIE